MAHASIVEHLFERARERPDGAAYYLQVDGAWQAVEWQHYAAEVKAAIAALLALDVPAAAPIAIVSDNRPEWAILHLATLALGRVSMGIYPRQPIERICRQLGQTRAVLALVDRPELARALTERTADMSALRHIVTIGPACPDSQSQGTRAESSEAREPDASGIGSATLEWSQFTALATVLATPLATPLATTDESAPGADVSGSLADIDPRQPATLTYTPGQATPGAPTIATHENLLAVAHALSEALDITERDWTLSYLPLAHPLEQALNIHIPVLVGALVYYAEAPEKVAHNLRQVQPSVFTASPRIWRVMHQTIAASLTGLTGWQRRLLNWARALATRVQVSADRGARPGLGTRMSYRLAHYLVIGKLARAIGLTNARVCLSTGDTLAPETRAFFASLDVTVRELYGQVSTSCAISVARAGANRPGTVGTPLVDVRVESTGELSVRGPAVCRHRWTTAGMPDSAPSSLNGGPDDSADSGPSDSPDDGPDDSTDGGRWQRTGDRGHLDDDGYLTVIGRMDEIWADADGAPVGASELEHALMADPAIASAVLIADPQGRPRALCRLADEASDSDTDTIADALTRLAERHERLPTIVSHAPLQRDLTVEGGELTPMFTVRRGHFKIDS